MIYHQTVNRECISVRPLDNVNKIEYIELVKHGSTPMLAVWIDGHEDEWIWEFELFNPSDYERIKMNIFDAVFECDTMLELVEALDAIFRNGFEDILIVDECDDCHGCTKCRQ